MSAALKNTVFATLQVRSYLGLIWKGEFRGSDTQARQWLADHLKTIQMPDPLLRIRASTALHNYRNFHTEIIGTSSLVFTIKEAS